MKPIRNILVPTDFVSTSREALAYGVSLAEKFDASLTIAHVVEYPTAVSYVLPLATFVLEEHHTRDIEEKLRELIPVETRDSLDYKLVVRSGIVADELLDTITEERVDLVVMERLHRGAVSRWFLGSVTDRLLRRVPVPLITIASPDSRLPGPGAFGIRRVLFATDLSEPAASGLEFAYTLARACGAELKVLHVVAPLRWDIPSHYVPLGTTQEHQALREELAQMLESSIPENLKSDGRVSWQLGDGVPWKVILDTADQDNSDLIVVSLQGKGKVERALIGVTAERVVRGSRRPVLAIPAV